MAMPPKPFIGIDRNKEPSATITTHHFIDPRTGRGRLLTQEQYDHLVEQHEYEHYKRTLREWLVVDYKAGTTRGADQRAWMKAQLYLRTGREVRVQWRKTTS